MKFSIITATYNKRGESLNRLVSYIQKQTFQDFEHIICYQDSQYIQIDAPKTKHIVVTDCTEFGNKQRQAGIDAASGEFILMVDDDNILFERALEKIAALTENADVVYSPIFHRKNEELGTKYFKHGEVDLLQWAIRTNLARKVQFPSYGYSADWEYFNALINFNPRIVKGEEIIGVHWFPADIDQIKNIPGWFNCRKLYQCVAGLLPRDAKCAEVGVFMGRSAISLAKSLRGKNGTLYAIDSWIRRSDKYIYPDSDFTYQQFLAWVKKFGMEKVIVPIRCSSNQAYTQFQDEFFDFVFIDADHSYEAVKEDIELWYPKVKKGGLLCGDDYHDNWPGVKQAVDERFGKDFSLIGRGWIVKK